LENKIEKIGNWEHSPPSLWPEGHPFLFLSPPRGPSWHAGPQLLLLRFSVARFLPWAQLCFLPSAGPAGRRSISSSRRPSVTRPSPLLGRPSQSRRAPASLSCCGHVPPLRLTRRARSSALPSTSARCRNGLAQRPCPPCPRLHPLPCLSG